VPTLNDLWDKKNKYTRGATELSRTLCLSGLAVVWIFRVPSTNGSAIPTPLMWCAGLIVTALGLDLLQYVLGARGVEKVARSLEAAGKKGPDDVSYPDDHPGLTNRIWKLKIWVVLIAWAILLIYVVSRAVVAELPAISK
jgi:hypothetical protein